MKLTLEQQALVDQNIGLVGKVIKDKVHGINQPGMFSYDDIFQIGCIGLCKAAATDKGGCFSTYAYRLIWNEICSALIYATRRNTTETTTDPEIMTEVCSDLSDYDIDNSEVLVLLNTAASQTSGVTAKGIEALKMSAQGYSSREIGNLMNASANNVTAWISKARKYLKSIPEFLQYQL